MVFKNIRKGAKANIIFVHGYRSHAYAKPIERFVEKLFWRGCSIFRFDLPFHGPFSWVPSNGFTAGHVNSELYIARILDMTSRVLKEHRRVPTLFVGESLGAVLACRVLQTYPGILARMKGVVCIGMPFSVDHNASWWVRMASGVILRSPFLQDLLAFLPVSRPDVPPAEKRKNNDGCFEQDPLYFTGSTNLHSALEVRKMVIAMKEEMSILEHVPKLFIHGVDDMVAPYDETALHIGNGHMYAMYGVGHHVLYEKGDEVAQVVGGWIDTIIQTNSTTPTVA